MVRGTLQRGGSDLWWYMQTGSQSERKPLTSINKEDVPMHQKLTIALVRDI